MTTMPPGPASSTGAEGTVLLVEDDELVRAALCMSLRHAHFEVVLAHDLEQAVRLFDARTVDVVVTDLIMPGGTGLELLRHVEAEDPTIPVIIITAHQGVEAAAAAVREHAFDYLTKPVPRRQLTDAVARAVSSRRATAWKRHEQERLKEEHRQLSVRHQRTTMLLSVLFDRAVEAILVLDNRGRLADASNSFTTLVGRPLYDLLDLDVNALFEPHPTEGDLQTRVVAVASTQGAHWRGEVTVLTAGGRRLPAKISLSACETPAAEGEEPAAGSDVERYVLALLYYENAHEELSRQLQQADRLATIGLLAGSAAHEIKNELGPLMGYLSMIERGGANPVESGMIKIMRESVRRVHEHVEQILEPLRPRIRTRGAVVLSESIDSILVLLRRAGRLRRLKLEVVQPHGDVVVHADKDEVHQIALNLITNAIDALGDGNGGERGSIRITTGYEDDSGVLRIEDTGSGVPPHLRARVFEPFFTTKGSNGTGLGLPVVQDIVRSLGGRVALASEPAVGTVVTAWIPRYRPNVESA